MSVLILIELGVTFDVPDNHTILKSLVYQRNALVLVSGGLDSTVALCDSALQLRSVYDNLFGYHLVNINSAGIREEEAVDQLQIALNTYTSDRKLRKIEIIKENFSEEVKERRLEKLQTSQKLRVVNNNPNKRVDYKVIYLKESAVKNLYIISLAAKIIQSKNIGTLIIPLDSNHRYAEYYSDTKEAYLNFIPYIESTIGRKINLIFHGEDSKREEKVNNILNSKIIVKSSIYSCFKQLENNKTTCGSVSCK